MRKKLLSLLLWCCLSGNAFALPSVTVMADPDLSVAITEIARNYSREKNIVVSTSFVAQKTQQSQITEGAAADILITPDQHWLDALKTQGVIDIYSQTGLVRNRLALAGPVESPLDYKPGSAFPAMAIIKEMHGESLFAIGNPEALPEGTYSKQALRKLGVAEDLEPYTVYLKEQAQLFDIVTKQQGYGLFFYSEVIDRNDLRVIGLLPDDSYAPIGYYAAVIAGDNMDEARKFLQYLKSAAALTVFQTNGFSGL